MTAAKIGNKGHSSRQREALEKEVLCIHQLFEAQVERTPEAVAVSYQDMQLTYRHLNQRANQLAHYLRKLGVGPEVLVGLCVERSPDMLVGLLGILKAGGAYVPLDPTYPQERLAFMLRDAQVPVLLSQTALQTALPPYHGTLVFLDGDHPISAQESPENLNGEAQPEHLAYVIYTSGSTGVPKGVLVTHRNVARLFTATEAWYHFHESDVWTCFHSYAFDFSVWELWGALLSGGRVVVVPYVVSRSPDELYTLLLSERVTVLNQTPSAFYQLSGYEASRRGPDDLALRLVIFGGEALEIPRLRAWFHRHGDQQPHLVNMYGITETTVHVTYRPLAVVDAEAGAGSVIGAPLPDLHSYVLDPQLHLLPRGVPGELYVGGAGVARGYLNRPDLTAQRFLPDPFTPQPGQRMYKTGDLARYLANGELAYLGRIDQQVKLRGYRIELGEIESVLAQHPQVREAAVLAREDTPGEKRIVAYIVPQPGQSIAFKDIRAFLKEHLPEYMLPAASVVLSAFPLTPNGKLNRKALPAPEAGERNGADTYVAPTLIEHYQLVEIWEELLDTRPIGIKDNFFFLGGHSLLAMRLAARIKEVFGKKISMATLFTGPTIEEITNALQNQEEHQSRAPIFAVQTAGSRRPFFFMHGAWSGGGFYCYRLARDLGPDQPFYALQPYRMDGLPVPPSFEQMAREHLEAIRAIQPEGPYLLGGFCNGGLVAAEMARQLQQEGQTVELMVMVDPSEPARVSQRLARSAIHALGAVLNISEEKQLDLFLRLRLPFFYIRDIYRYLRYPAYRITAARIRGHRSWLGRAFPELSLLAMPTQQLREDWAAVHLWTLPGRIPDFSADQLAFFWSKQGYTGDKGVWGKLTQMKTAENYIIPGWHSTWTAEKIRALAEQLSACMSKTTVEEAREEALMTEVASGAAPGN